MIVVRRIVLKRLPHQIRPAANTIPTAITASVIWIGANPRSRNWSGKRGSAFENWKIDWPNHSPIEALTAIQVGASSRTYSFVMIDLYRARPEPGSSLRAVAAARRSSASRSVTPNW